MMMTTTTTTTTTTMILGRVGGQLGLFLAASVLTITELDDDDNEDDDDDDFRQSGCGWPAVTFSGGQCADHHRA